MPQVSVIIPAYNAAAYLPEAIESVLNQTYGDFEVIVVDDGSTDKTREVAQRYRSDYPQKMQYRFQDNKGVSTARNVGMRETNGKYLAFLDADDVWLETYLEKMVLKIEEGFDWVVCDNFKEYIDIRTGRIERLSEVREMDESWDTPELCRQFLKCDRIGGPSKVLVKRGVLTGRGIFFDETLKSREDWDFYLQLLGNGCSLGWVREPLYVYQIRNNDSNATRRMGWKSLQYRLRLFEKHRETYEHYGMRSSLGGHYYALGRDFWHHTHDIPKVAWCLFRNLQLKGLSDVFALYRRKRLDV